MTRGEKVVAFIERFCRTPAGDHVGKPIALAEFQKKFILEIYDNPAVTRRAYLSLARKNGKTALIAAILLAHLCGPEAKQNSEIISGARSKDQAAIVFRLACQMIQLNPTLTELTKISPSGKRITGLAKNVEYKALAAEGSTAHGLSPVLAILDEVGQVKGGQDDFIDAITSSQGAYDNPLLIAISTQAPTDADLFSIWLDDAERSNDPKIVSHVYAAKPDAEVLDEAAWKAANPALGLFRSYPELKGEAVVADRSPPDEMKFRNLNLNQRVMLESSLLSASVWKACGGPIDESAFYDGPVYGGLDLSRTTDLTALVLVAKKDGIWHVKPFFWTPRDTMLDRGKRDHVPYADWARDGLVFAPPGVAIDYAFVVADIARLTAGMNIAKINFDRHMMANFTAELQRQDVALPMEPFGQGYVSMMPAINATEIEFLEQRVRHGGHKVLTDHVKNCVVHTDPAGNRKLDKGKSNGRIDGIVSLVMALGAGIGGGEAMFTSPWDDPAFSLVAA
jgi:phage terminase large subunit-like protein